MRQGTRVDAAEGPPFLNVQHALLGLQRLSGEEGESPSHLGKEIVPIGGEEAGTHRNLPKLFLKLFFFSPEQIPPAYAGTTASSSCMTLTSWIKIGIF